MGQTGQVVTLELTFLVKRVEGEWEALCLELDIASCGATQKQAIESLQGLVELYVDDCIAENDIPVPLRPVPREAIQEFLSPPDEREEVRITSHRQSMPLRYAYS